MKENTWFKSSFSGEASCVEVNISDDVILVRDSKLGINSPVLTFTRAEWNALGKGMLAGEFGTF